MRIASILVAVAVLALCVGVGATADDEEDVKISLLSDLHYDPLYGQLGAFGQCTDGTYSLSGGHIGCDSPLELVTAAITDAMHQNASMVLMAGDWVRHDMDRVPDQLLPAYTTLAKLLASFRGPPLVPLPNLAAALGNNDFVPDYHFNLSTPTHPVLQNLTEVLRNHSVLAESEVPTFAKCGYYRRDVPDTKLTLIVLNTLIWSAKLDPPLSANDTDPCGQMEYLHASLKDVRQRGRRAYIISHIPPVINLFGVLVDMVGLSNSAYWADRFTTGYKDLLVWYQDVIAVQFFGHTHQFSFLADLEMGVPLFIIPSVTPVFGNNPSYLVATADPTTWAITSLRQRYLSQAHKWIDGIELSDVFNNNNLTVAGLNDGAGKLIANHQVYDEFVVVHSGGIIADTDYLRTCVSEQCRRIVSCSMQHTEAANVSSCTSMEETLLTRSVNVAVYVMFAFGVLITVVSLARLVYHHRELASDEADEVELKAEVDSDHN